LPSRRTHFPPRRPRHRRSSRLVRHTGPDRRPPRTHRHAAHRHRPYPRTSHPRPRLPSTHEAASNALLIVSSAASTSCLFMLARAIFGPTPRPFFRVAYPLWPAPESSRRRILPAPEGMIWRNPGFPSLPRHVMAYPTISFSPATPLCCLRCRGIGPPASAVDPLGVAIALFEIATVLALRAALDHGRLRRRGGRHCFIAFLATRISPPWTACWPKFNPMTSSKHAASDTCRHENRIVQQMVRLGNASGPWR